MAFFDGVEDEQDGAFQVFFWAGYVQGFKMGVLVAFLAYVLGRVYGYLVQ